MTSEIRTSFSRLPWSGGRTTELYIYPPEAKYAKRDFLFRISSATVEIENATFTSLPDIHRTLMILEGEIRIHHEGQYDKEMKKFDIDSFQGSWKSTSKGRCIDFNLMCSAEANGTVEAILMDKGASITLQTDSDHRWNFYYVHKGMMTFHLEEHSGELHAGSLLLLESAQKIDLKLHSLEQVELVSCHVMHHIP